MCKKAHFTFKTFYGQNVYIKKISEILPTLENGMI